MNESPPFFFKQLKKNCSEEFLRSILNAYLTSLVIDKFPWKSIPVKEKAALEAMLCDIILRKDDFIAIKEHEQNGAPLEDRIKNHPTEIANLLSKKKDIIPS